MKKEKTLEEQLEFKKKQLNQFEKDLLHYEDLFERHQNASWQGYIVLTKSKILKCKSEILLLEGAIWEQQQNQPQ